MLKTIAKQNMQKVTGAFALSAMVMAGVFAGAQALAAGPEFNIFPISYTGEQNHDYPLLDTRNVSDAGNFSVSQNDHDNGITADPGEIVEFVIYYHNGAVDAPENIAKNVRISASLPSGLSKAHTVSASISADNAVTVSSASKGGNMTVNISGTETQSLQYIAGSTRWFPDHGAAVQSLPDGIVTGGVNIGDIRGCWNFSGFVKFQARVSSNQPVTGVLQIDKTVSNLTSGTSFQNSVNADPSNIVRFKVEVVARDNNVQNVIVRDILPSELSFESGTLRINGSARSGSEGLFGSGYSHGTLSKDQTLTLQFDVRVASASFFDGTSRTLTNTANARGDSASTVQDTAEVRVQGQVLGSSFILSKSAFNQTQGVNAQSVLANSGDVINYTLTYRNTGATSITNVIVEDDLTDVLRHADLVNSGDGQLIGNTIRFPSITVPASVSIDKTFQVRVREISANQTDLTVTNFYGNQVDFQLRPPVVKGTFIAPKSGPEDWVAPLFALLLTAGIYLKKKYQFKIAGRI